MANLNLDKVYKYCKLLHIDIVKDEIEEIIKDYTLEEVKFENGNFVSTFHKGEKNSIILTTSFNNISLTKFNESIVERITIDDNMLMTNVSVEKREKGVIYSILQKQFGYSNRFGNQIVLVDLAEQRLAFTREKFEELFNNVDFNTSRLTHYLLKFKTSERKVDLKEKSDYYSEFSTHMNYYYSTLDNPRKYVNNIYPSKTFLNGQDISDIYDTVDGKDKLYRIYDLYRGIINSRNENDINAINLGLLNPNAFDLMSSEGITENEESLVGKSLQITSEDYINYIKELFNNRFGYTGKIDLNRESILTGILYQMSGPERAKREIERKLGISYSEFEQLDLDEQHKLIEEKTGKKLKPDYRLYIDGIPMDEDHIITREQIDRELDMMTASGPKRILMKIFKPLNKKR